MHHPRPRLPRVDRPNPAAGPDDHQTRALERRHSLDEQQRAIRDSQPYPPPHRRRPPC